ncbi:MAG: response regulator transcription factor [Spirochaetes bacterium]|nr:response regulator transcription factor [Spirochaetota bacterium]MBU0955796.1 response regulator transcription factor [Spirochaetota bacterium]
MSASLYECKILIIDDEQEIAELLSTVLQREGFKQVHTAATARDGLESFRRLLPDLVLLDIMLPDGNGYELFGAMQQIKSVPILFVSAKDEELDRLLGFAMGAEDYITKPFSAKEVAYRVKARLKQRLPAQPAPPAPPEPAETKVLGFGDVRIDLAGSEVSKAGRKLDFTAKEFKMLLYFVQNPGRVLSKEQICQAVWGGNYSGVDNTISVHIRKIRLKIEDDPSSPRWIQTVVGLGYKFVLQENLP